MSYKLESTRRFEKDFRKLASDLKQRIDRQVRDGSFMLAVPLSHCGTSRMAKVVTVEVDEKGRVHIPSSIRQELKSRRFTLSVKNGRLLMDPVKQATTVRGKYRGLLRASVEEIEEAQERFVAANRR